MDTLEFAKEIPAEKLAEIFKDYFEQHMAVYEMLRGLHFVSINSININAASIIYSVKLLDESYKNNLLRKFSLDSGSVTIYGKKCIPDVYMNGDLLCITIKK